VTAKELSSEDLTQFGVRLEDEGPHPFDPAVEWWNESWFWDWHDATGENAGHCRIGIHPNQQRAWIWFFLFREGEWVALEEPRLPLADLDASRLAYDRWGLRCSWEVRAPLRAGRLRCEGFGRVVAGPRTGMILPVGADLEIEALGPPHSIGRSRGLGHESEAYPASRFEQPISVRGTQRIAAAARPFAGHGERDHSWGPRWWNMEWTVLVVTGESLRLQCAEARIPNVGRFVAGYLQRERMIPLTEVAFDFAYAASDVLKPVAGRVAVRAEDGDALAGRVEALTAAEIDLTHAFVPPRRSLYRRALVRLTPDGGTPVLGWVEFNRFLDES
jgi:hypothetical protein